MSVSVAFALLLLVGLLTLVSYVDRVYQEIGKFLSREFQDNTRRYAPRRAIIATTRSSWDRTKLIAESFQQSRSTGPHGSSWIFSSRLICAGYVYERAIESQRGVEVAHS